MVGQEQRLRQALSDFLSAFENLSLTPFMAAFSEEATVFFPFADVPLRANGIKEIRGIFAPYFESRSRETSGPPYLDLKPIDLEIVLTGPLALVSFHLHDEANGKETLCRRTVVWKDDGTRWRILHLHASNIALISERTGRLN